MPESHPAASSADSAARERLLDQFDQAWQQGLPPAIRDFLPAGLRGRRRLLHGLIEIDLEYRWRQSSVTHPGDSWPPRPRLEDYVARLPRLGSLQRLPLTLIGEEYRVRQRWGDRPGHAEYVQRFPRQAAALRTALAEIDAELCDELATLGGRGRRSAPVPAARSHSRPAALRCPHCRQVLDVRPQTSQELACPACGGTFSVESLSTTPGQVAQPPSRRLGRYELGPLLGTGAFGSVWQALDTELGREVAIKLPRSGCFPTPAEEERFLREARSAAQLHHPGIVAVHDVGREQDMLFIVSELVRGVSLAERLREARLSFQEAAELVAQVADALDYAHRQGVVHRDVKPSNILLGLPEESAGNRLCPRIMDFGLALRDAAEVTMTVDGQLLGTPAYMSPEQVRNPHAVDGRTDVYSLGVVLYELLTGELPFRGSTRMLLMQLVSDEPRPPRQLNERIPPELETICLKCLHKEPGRRYRTAGGLAADLRRWLQGQPIQARPMNWAERWWLWTKRHRTLIVLGGLGAAGLVTVTGAVAAAILVAVAVASLLFALHQARTATELTQGIADVKRTQKKTAATLQFALRQCAVAREERQRAVAAEAVAKRRLAQVRELVHAILFELPDRMGQVPGPAPARAFLVRKALAYLDALVQEAGDDGLLLREAAIGYGRVAEVQGSGNVREALVSQRKSLRIFVSLAAARPDNVQAQRDLAASRRKVADLERALARA